MGLRSMFSLYRPSKSLVLLALVLWEDGKVGLLTTPPRRERNSLRSNSSRGPKFFLARKMLAAPPAWPDNNCPWFPMNAWQTRRIITAQRVFEAIA